jgi:cyclic dehypoxanthinyl futalosine synthase
MSDREPNGGDRDRPLANKPPRAPATPRLERISPEQALEIYRRQGIHEIGRVAYEACERLHPEPYRTYAVDRNINYSNICTSFCTFCNFKVPPGDAAGYVLTHDQVGRKIQELVEIGGTQTLMQGGIVPMETLPLEWYLDLLRHIRANWPQIHIHAFSPPEIWSLHSATGMPLRDLLLRLQEAGLATIPGGGAEILVDRVRRKISPKKCTAAEWLEVMRTAHSIGMRTTATMMFGHLETIAERIEHFERVRQLQDETGGFTAFILWPFQPDNTPLGRMPRGEPSAGAEPDGERLHLAGAHEYLRMLALARLYLDNVPNLQSSWVTMGPKVGQLALFFGANDMGSVMMEENVVSAAGTTYRLDEAMIRRLIGEAGWQPRKRDCYYKVLE